MAYEFKTTVMAGGIRFFLIGRAQYPPGGVVNKFQTAMTNSRTKLANAIALISGNPPQLTPRQSLVLEYCFNPTAAQMANTLMTVKRVLENTLAGLRTADLNLYEPDPAILPAGGAEGYVKGFGPFRGDIHTRFDLDEGRTLNNIIHEATHKFARTEDRGYMAASIGPFLHVRGLEIPGNAPINNQNGLINADSYSAFAANLT
jgi:hypothetical protein